MQDRVDTAWDGILDDDENIQWQGRPDTQVSLSGSAKFMFLFGCAFAGFALFWMIMASMAGGFFWMFGLIHLCVGVGIIWSATFGRAYVRKHTWYTLTNKRAFIASDLPIKGRSLKSYPITDTTQIEFKSGNLDSILFATKIRRGKNGTSTVPIGFERISDGKKVLQMMRAIQKDAI